jgi:hypothetical protein
MSIIEGLSGASATVANSTPLIALMRQPLITSQTLKRYIAREICTYQRLSEESDVVVYQTGTWYVDGR